MVIGALIVKHKMNLSDEEIILAIQENPYMQYKLYLSEYTEVPVFDPILFVTIRKRLQISDLNGFTDAFLKLSIRKIPPWENRSMLLQNIKGKLYADKGYIGQALFENLFINGIQFVTKVKNNMKNSLMSIADKILLRKRALIETVNDELNEHCTDRTLQTSFIQ